jgi:hypothetical protein
MAGPSVRSARWLGALAGTFAILLQLAFASWVMALLGAPSQPFSAFDEHALCRAAGNGVSRSELPSGETPVAPKHKAASLCCLCHQLPGMQPLVIPASQPVAYGLVVRDERDSALFIAEERSDPAKARAPPILT